MFLSLIGMRRLPWPGRSKRRCTAIAAPAWANSGRCPSRVPGRLPTRDFRPPKCTLACRLPGPIASEPAGLAGEGAARRCGDQPREFSRMHAQPAPAWLADDQRPGLLRFLRTSLTSTFRVSRRVGEREGERSARCDRLPSRSRRCRARISILAAALVRLLPSSCHQGGTAHLTFRRLKDLITGPWSERSALKHHIQASQAISSEPKRTHDIKTI
jgi:hypothetical protein